MRPGRLILSVTFLYHPWLNHFFGLGAISILSVTLYITHGLAIFLGMGALYILSVSPMAQPFFWDWGPYYFRSRMAEAIIF